MEAEIFERNRRIMQQYHLNDNLQIEVDSGRKEFGIITHFRFMNNDKKIYLGVTVISVTGLRDTDPPAFWLIDPDNTKVEVL